MKKVQLTNCWVESVPLTGGENGKVVEEEYKGGFYRIEIPCKH